MSDSTVDRPTLVAIAVVAYALANVVHEGVGHGGACVLAGGRPLVLSAVHFEGVPGLLDAAGQKWMAAGGTLANLAVGAVALAALRAGRGPSAWRYFLWLLMTVNLLQAAGYWMFSGIGNVGDWAFLIGGLSPRWVFRAALALAGLGAYWAAVVFSLRELGPFVGDRTGRFRRALPLTVIPYLAGGCLYLAAGVANPVGWLLVAISAVAASFGGTAGLAWMAQLLRGRGALVPTASDTALELPRSVPWLVAGAVALLVFVAVLGPGVRF